MKRIDHAMGSLTGVRPTADLTLGNYFGAIKPILDREKDAADSSAVFLAEMHATTTDSPRDVMHNSREVTRTLIACGVMSEIYSQKEFRDEVLAVQAAIMGLTSVTRLLRLPTLKDKVGSSNELSGANVALATYPMLMASDIILARPAQVPTGKDQLPHLEITNELTRSFNREFDAELPLPSAIGVDPPNVLSLDGEGKMSKSRPKGAIYLSDTPKAASKKIMRATTAPEPGEQMDQNIGNLEFIGVNLPGPADAEAIRGLAGEVKAGKPAAGELKKLVAANVEAFIDDITMKRSGVSDADVRERLAQGNAWFRPAAEETVEYVDSKYWAD